MKKLLTPLVLSAVSLGACAQPTTQETTTTTSSQTSQTAAVAPDTSQIVTEELHATDDTRDIYGYITAPVNYKETTLPTIIFSHGFGGRAETGDAYAQQLARQGYAVYSFDFQGGNPSSRSGNDTLAMSALTEQADLEVVVKTLQMQSYVDRNNLFLMGQSQGGVVSTMVAGEMPDAIRGMILIFPAFVMFDDARSLFQSVDEIPEVYNFRGNNVGRVYFERSLDYDIFQTMRQYHGPVLIVHGTEDNIAPYRYSQQAIQTFEDAQLITIDGAGHYFNNSQIQGFMPQVDDFIATHVQ